MLTIFSQGLCCNYPGRNLVPFANNVVLSYISYIYHSLEKQMQSDKVGVTENLRFDIKGFVEPLEGLCMRKVNLLGGT